MFQVPHSVPRSRPWPLALLWISVALTGLVASRLISPLIYRSFESSVDDIRLVSGIMSIINGLAIITLQWLVLRRYFPGMYRWVPVLGSILVAASLLQNIAYGLAQAIIAAFGSSIGSAGLIENALSAASLAIYVFWALVNGLAGWWMFRSLTRRAWLWPAALLLGALGQSLISITVLWPLLRSGSSFNLSTYSLIIVMFNLLSAALQAAVLVAFLRERQRQPAGPSTPLGY